MALFPFSASVLSIVSITMELNKLFAHAQRGETLPLGLLEFTLSLVYNGYTLVLLIILTSQTRLCACFSRLALHCVSLFKTLSVLSWQLQIIKKWSACHLNALYEPSGANAIFRAEHDTSAKRETRGRENSRSCRAPREISRSPRFIKRLSCRLCTWWPFVVSSANRLDFVPLTNDHRGSYRLNRMEEDTISSKPLKDWRLLTNHSKVTMEWLLWNKGRLQEEERNVAQILLKERKFNIDIC